MLPLRLNDMLDPELFAAEYAAYGLVQIPNVLPDDVAQSVFEMLRTQVKWRLVIPQPGEGPGAPDQIMYLGPEDMQAMGQQAVRQLIGEAEQRASRNYGFLYNVYPMIEAKAKGWDEGHPIHTLTDFVNSPEFLDFGARVIGYNGALAKAEAQATFYGRGNYLTRHIDEGFNQERRAAYTFGFSPHWEPDWGGLLAFIDDNMDIERAFIPRFNTLTFFDGRKIHSVTPVANFAAGPRLQVTGWLLDDRAR